MDSGQKPLYWLLVSKPLVYLLNELRRTTLLHCIISFAVLVRIDKRDKFLGAGESYIEQPPLLLEILLDPRRCWEYLLDKLGYHNCYKLTALATVMCCHH